MAKTKITPGFFAKLILLFSLFLIVAPSNAENTKPVLILLSGHSELPWQNKIEQGIAEQKRFYAENSEELPTIYIESLDLFRNPPKQDDTRLDTISEKYKDIEFKLIITEGIAAARLVEKSTVFTQKTSSLSLPVINFNEIGIGRGHNVDFDTDYQNLATMIQYFMPDVESVVIMGNISLTQNAKIATSVSQLLDVKVTIWQDRIPLNDLNRRISKLSEKDAIIFAPYFSFDKDGKLVVPKLVLEELVDYSPAPIFTIYDSLFLPGVVGGYLRSGEELGKMLVKFVQSPTLSWSAKDFHYCGFDYSSLKRWNLDTKNLPESGRFRNQQAINLFSRLAEWVSETISQKKSPLDKVCN